MPLPKSNRGVADLPRLVFGQRLDLGEQPPVILAKLCKLLPIFGDVARDITRLDNPFNFVQPFGTQVVKGQQQFGATGIGPLVLGEDAVVKADDCDGPG